MTGIHVEAWGMETSAIARQTFAYGGGHQNAKGQIHDAVEDEGEVHGEGRR